MGAGTTTYQPAAPGFDADGVLDGPRPGGVRGRATAASRRLPCSTRSTAASPTPACVSSCVDGRHLVLRGEGAVPAVVTVATQPRVADDLPAGPLRQRLARLLDVRALLRLVEVTSQRIEADEAQPRRQGHRRGDRPPTRSANGGPLGTGCARRGRRS